MTDETQAESVALFAAANAITGLNYRPQLRFSGTRAEREAMARNEAALGQAYLEAAQSGWRGR